MKIGYPCINRTVECHGGKTFRLKSYSASRLREVVGNNLRCLSATLDYNRSHGIYFFRISSDLVPFASHPVCRVRWQKIFADDLGAIGRFIKRHRMRISMHPDQFTLINSMDEDIFRRSVRELVYHAEVLGLLGLGDDAKIQIHVGGVYGDKAASSARFIERYGVLPEGVRNRLVIENDERCYSVSDCLAISSVTGVPVLFDAFHDSILRSGMTAAGALKKAAATWSKCDGIPMVDYSSQQAGARTGSHAGSIDIKSFVSFLEETRPLDFDMMLEIKDKEASALRAIAAASTDRRLYKERRL